MKLERKMSRNYKLITMILALFMCLTFISGCGKGDAKDQVMDLVQSDDEHVLSVKNGSPTSYPDKKYGESFDAFFGSPTWKYFKGTKEGPDEDEDGKPDYTEENVDIVEFTGYCTYQDVEVKALIQFTLDKESDTFEATYLSFNEVPQNAFMLASLLSRVFEGDEDGAAASGQKTEEVAEKENNSLVTPDYSSTIDRYRDVGDCEYAIFDIDKDGVDELIIGYGEVSAEYCYDLYSGDKDGGPVCIGEVPGECSFYVAEDNNGIYAVSGKMGYETVRRITIKDSKAVVEVMWEREVEDYYENPNPIVMKTPDNIGSTVSNLEAYRDFEGHYVSESDRKKYVEIMYEPHNDAFGYVTIYSGGDPFITDLYVDMSGTSIWAEDNYEAIFKYQDNYGYDSYLCLYYSGNDGMTLTLDENSADRNADTYVMGSEAAEFIIPDSSFRAITESDLISLTKEECRIARNEIYARHGKIFQSADLQEYFGSTTWYVTDEGFNESDLSQVEKDNISVIAAYEKKMGYN